MRSLPRFFIAILLFVIFFSQHSYSQYYRVSMVTSLGTIRLVLYDGTPKHRDNFVRLCRKHFYDGILFHRVIQGFMIQAGDPDSKKADSGTLLGDGDLPYTIPAEINPGKYFNKRGALGAARDDNPQKNSSATQFYIVTGKVLNEQTLQKEEQRSSLPVLPSHHAVYLKDGGAPHLDGNYTVFGEVLSGMDIADRIAAAPRDKHDRPYKDIKLLKVRVQRKFLFFWL